jgi:hypothetical protein
VTTGPSETHRQKLALRARRLVITPCVGPGSTTEWTRAPKETAMTDGREAREETPDEYDYDLAHEEATPSPPGSPPREPQLPPDMHAAGSGGDYGHDLAHDMG